MGEFNLGTLLWALIVFGSLLAVLARYAYKPFNDLLAQREKTIRDALNEAKRAREEVQKTLETNQEQLEQARTEARKIIDEGHRIVDQMKNEAQERAKQEAQELVERTRREIEQQTQRSLDELKGTVAGLSVRVARQIIRENLDETRHEELADTFIERLKKSHATRSR